MKGSEQAIALALIRQHPGWSDARVVAELDRRGHAASRTAVRDWRQDAGLAPATDDVTAYPPPRVQGVWLACGHLVHPEKIDGGRGRCDYCGGVVELARG